MQWVRRSTVTTAVAVAAVASAGAGLVDAAAAGSHTDDASLAWIFAGCAVAQLGWAALVVARPTRVVLLIGLGLDAACVATWLLGPTVGRGGTRALGMQDLVAVLLTTVASIATVAALVGHSRRLDLPAALAAGALVIVLAVPAMATIPTRDATTPVAVAAASGDDAVSVHDHAAGATPDTGPPIISVSDPRLTRSQRQRAVTLLDGTRLALAAFPDEATVVAAGYTSIGDGRRAGTFEHFVNAAYMHDGKELDPMHIESLVFERQADGTKKLASAMYILEPGATLASVPDIAGGLTQWHDHDNLCWEGARVVGLLVDGRCVPRGEFRGTTPPMIHVWLEDTPCGPFTGIEGHGGTNCAHAHTAA